MRRAALGTATTSECTTEQGRLTPKLSSDLDNGRAGTAEGAVGAPFAEDLARELPAPRRATRVTGPVANGVTTAPGAIPARPLSSRLLQRFVRRPEARRTR